MTASPEHNQDDLVYHWNEVERKPPARSIEFDDESLRDGLQSPTVVIPPIEDKIRILHMMAELGIDAADIGLPAAGGRMASDVLVLAKEIAKHKLPIAPGCAARTLAADIQPILDVSQATGLGIGVSMFIGSSPIRKYAESWTIDKMERIAETAVTFAVKHDAPVMFVTEDTTRADPDTLTRLYGTAIDAGARRICIADTVGYATPHGTKKLVKFVKGIVKDRGVDVKIDWHGHRDRGLGIANALAAAEAGADRVHGTGLGVGERSGNASMEQLLVNFRLAGYIDNDLSKLSQYCSLISEAFQVPIPCNQPIVGRDAFRTCTGVHAAAVIKAIRKGNDWLANRVYSSVPADWVGLGQRIEVGPMSGESNVRFWLDEHNITADDGLVESILSKAKQGERTLTSDEILEIIRTQE